MGDHALLSPSSAKRWIACTPSARIETRFADKSSVFADEGTLAHRLAEVHMLNRLKRISIVDALAQIAEIEANELYKHEMAAYVEQYCDYIWEQWLLAKQRNPDAEIFTERKVDLTKYIPEGFGTIDISIIADHTLTIIDLKYGKGVPVSAIGNEQMLTYGLGSLEDWGILFDIQKIKMVIYQPRLDNISEYEVEVKDLIGWAEDILMPAAHEAFAGTGDLVAGEHCRFCRAKPTCATLADYNLELGKYDFVKGESLSPEQVSDILSRAAMFTNWLTAVTEYALEEAVNHGVEWPGYKLVRGRANRAYSDKDAVKDTLHMLYGDEIFEAPKLLGITAMEGLLGKQNFSTLLAGLIVKPQGKPALVPESDKRQAINSTADAAKDFAPSETDLLD